MERKIAMDTSSFLSVAPSATMVAVGMKSERIFKTAWFAKASGKALISDDELCSAITQVMLGQADNLG